MDVQLAKGALNACLLARCAWAMALVARLEQALQLGSAEEARGLGESWLKESGQWSPEQSWKMSRVLFNGFDMF